MDALPVEILEIIYSYLPLRDFLRARSVCRQWSRVRYPNVVDMCDIKCHERLCAKIEYTGRLKLINHVSRLDGKSVVKIRWGINSVEVDEMPQCPKLIVMPRTLRYLCIGTTTGRAMARFPFSKHLRFLQIDEMPEPLNPAWLPACLKFLHLEDVILMKGPLPPTLERLTLHVLPRKGRIVMPETLKYLKVPLVEERIVLNDALEELLVDTIVWCKPLLHLKKLWCGGVAPFAQLFPKLRDVTTFVKDMQEMHENMFPPTLRKVKMVFKGNTQPIPNMFGANTARVMRLDFEMENGRLLSGVIPETVVELSLRICSHLEPQEPQEPLELSSSSESLMEPGSLPSELVRLDLDLSYSCRPSPFDFILVESLPSSLEEVRIHASKTLLSVSFNELPNLRVFYSRYDINLPDTVEIWHIFDHPLEDERGDDDGDHLYGSDRQLRLKHVYLPMKFRRMKFGPNVRVTLH